MHAELLKSLTGKSFVTQPATLHGFQRYSLGKKGWPWIPVIVKQDDACVDGIIVCAVDNNSMMLLDDFEDVELGLYTRQRVEIMDSTGCKSEAFVYAAGPLALDFLSGDWCPDEFMAEHYADYRDRIIPKFLSERG